MDDLDEREIDALLEQLEAEERDISSTGEGCTTASRPSPTARPRANLDSRERELSKERRDLHRRIDELRARRDELRSQRDAGS